LVDQIISGRHRYYLRDIAHPKLKVLRNSPPNLKRRTLNDLRLKPAGSDLNPVRTNWQSGNLISAVVVRYGCAPDADLAADYSDQNCGYNRTVLIGDLSFDGRRGLCMDGVAEQDNNEQCRFSDEIRYDSR